MDKSSVIHFFEVFEKVIRYARIDVARIFVFSNRSRAQLDNLKEIFYVPTFCNLIGDAFWHAISFVFERAIPLCKRASTYPTRKWSYSYNPHPNCPRSTVANDPNFRWAPRFLVLRKILSPRRGSWIWKIHLSPEENPAAPVSSLFNQIYEASRVIKREWIVNCSIRLLPPKSHKFSVMNWKRLVMRKGSCCIDTFFLPLRKESLSDYHYA